MTAAEVAADSRPIIVAETTIVTTDIAGAPPVSAGGHLHGTTIAAMYMPVQPNQHSSGAWTGLRAVVHAHVRHRDAATIPVARHHHVMMTARGHEAVHAHLVAVLENAPGVQADIALLT